MPLVLTVATRRDPTDTAMYCLPLTMYVIGAAVVLIATLAAALMPSHAGPPYVLGLIAKGAGRAGEAAGVGSKGTQPSRSK